MSDLFLQGRVRGSLSVAVPARGALGVIALLTFSLAASPAAATIMSEGLLTSASASSTDGTTVWGDTSGKSKTLLHTDRRGKNVLDTDFNANGKTDAVKIVDKVTSQAIWGDNDNPATSGIFDPTRGSYHFTIDRSVTLRKGGTASNLDAVTTGAAASWVYNVRLDKGATLSFTYDVIGASMDGLLGDWEFEATGGMFQVPAELASSWMGSGERGTVSIHLDPGTYGFYFGGGAYGQGAANSGILDADLKWSLREDSAVPEPAAWVLMLGGFGMVGGTLRAGRRKAATVKA